jgi:hypothetical protein
MAVAGCGPHRPFNALQERIQASKYHYAYVSKNQQRIVNPCVTSCQCRPIKPVGAAISRDRFLISVRIFFLCTSFSASKITEFVSYIRRNTLCISDFFA